MDIQFENLEKIDLILEKIEKLESKVSGEKRWLNIAETSTYLGYSKDHLHKLKNEYFIEGLHYHKKAGRVLFDKHELDNWVTTNFNHTDTQHIIDSVLKNLT